MSASMNSNVFQKSPSIIRATEKQRKRGCSSAWSSDCSSLTMAHTLGLNIVLDACLDFFVTRYDYQYSLFHSALAQGTHHYLMDTTFTWPFINYWYDAEKNGTVTGSAHFGNSFGLAPRNGTPLAFLGNLLASMLDPLYLTCTLFAPLGGYVLLSFPWTPGRPS